jgi:hypothetical protein
MSPTDSLGVSWPALSDRVEPTNTLARWAATEPALAGIGTLDELAEIVHRGGNAARADELLGSLVRLAARDRGDDEEAALLVAHLLANGTRKLALQLRDLSSDIDDLVAGELWLRIRTFPWQRRTRAYAKSLLLDTRMAVLAELRPYRTRAGHGPVVLVDPIRTAAADGPAEVDLLDRHFLHEHDLDESGLVDVLRWAQRCGVVDSADVALLIDLLGTAERLARAGGESHRGVNVAAEIADVADRRGVHAKTIWRRRARVLTALRQASDDYLAAVA